MAGDWIKVQKDTPDKPEVLAIASRMNLDPDAVVGKLIRIWSWFDTHTIDGNALSVTFAFLDRLTGVTGFAEQVALVGWLEQNGQSLMLPNFGNHNGETAKKRSLGKKRTEKHRSNAESNAESNADSVTKTSPEKRREEKIYSVSKDTGVASDRENIFSYGIPLLTGAGIKESQARSFFGKLIKDNGDAAVVEALRECFRMKPIQPLEWLVAALNGSSRPQMNKQEALEASNMEIARRASERFLNEQA
ncbi:hypothetical protein [Caudoviricetes sp.]|nr:hypothetical protein [Caudoviricetes sp.]